MPEDEKSPTDGSGKDDKPEDKESKDKKGAAEDDDLSPEDITSAKSLFKALRDPDTAKELIETLARRSGILDKKDKPTEDEKDTKKALGKITKSLKAKLGPEFAKFSDAVGPALDEAMDEILSEHFNKFEGNNVAEKWSESVDKFMETHQFASKKVEKVMQELIEDSPPNTTRKGFSAPKYLQRMWKLAHDELSLELPGKEEKKANFLEDIVERDRPKNLTVSDAIDAAMKGIRFKN